MPSSHSPLKPGKGEQTRQLILDAAFRRATRLGLEGVTIGDLADELGMSKSGLFAHFDSKEALQLATVDFAAQCFVERVVEPSLAAPRGIPRLRALFQQWLAWGERGAREGGCFFVAAAFELDDRPGPVRDHLAQMQRNFQQLVSNIARTAISEGHFRADIDPAQVAFELYGIMLVLQHHTRLLADRTASVRAWAAFDRLVASASRHGKPGK